MTNHYCQHFQENPDRDPKYNTLLLTSVGSVKLSCNVSGQTGKRIASSHGLTMRNVVDCQGLSLQSLAQKALHGPLPLCYRTQRNVFLSWSRSRLPNNIVTFSTPLRVVLATRRMASISAGDLVTLCRWSTKDSGETEVTGQTVSPWLAPPREHFLLLTAALDGVCRGGGGGGGGSSQEGSWENVDDCQIVRSYWSWSGLISKRWLFFLCCQFHCAPISFSDLR